MSDDHIEALKEALSYKLLGHPYEPDNALPETSRIRRIASAVRAYDQGETGANSMREVFAENPIRGFDFQLWLQDRVQDGTYDPSVFDDDPDE